MDISVIICTYNGAQTIIQCLDALVDQQTNLKFEIIVVDNNSNDETYNLIDNFINDNNLTNFHLFKETNRGKVYALKRGINQSKGSVLIICDDDNILKRNYIQNAYNLFENNKKIGLACGVNTAISSVQLPRWFKECERLYACGKLGEYSGVLPNDKLVWGAGMVGRGNLLRAIYKSNIVHFTTGEFERDGVRNSAEDDELCIWIKYLNYNLYFSEDLHLYHIITRNRLTVESRDKLNYGIIEGGKRLKRHLRIMFKVGSKIEKRDFYKIFFLNDDGYIARLKFGFYKKSNPYINNYRVLTTLKNELKYED